MNIPPGGCRLICRTASPPFHILPDQAYDHLDGDRAMPSLMDWRGTFSLLYHGSLISRAGRWLVQHLTASKKESGHPGFH